MSFFSILFLFFKKFKCFKSVHLIQLAKVLYKYATNVELKNIYKEKCFSKIVTFIDNRTLNEMKIYSEMTRVFLLRK